MNIIKASAELWKVDCLDPKAIMRHIERAGRVCYKSEDRITDESCEKFIDGILRRGHHAVIEHGNMVIYARGDSEAYLNNLRNILSNFPVYLRTTVNISPETEIGMGMFVSGNIRAWRDVLTDALNLGLWIPAALEATLSEFGILFEDVLNMNRYGKPGWVKPVYNVEECHIVDPALMTLPDRKIHETFTVRFVCDRGISHEIVRHRPASYCQESTRYCNYTGGKFGGEITVIEPCFWPDPDSSEYRAWWSACASAEQHYIELITDGATPQQARSVLPNSLKTEVVMTARADEWIHFFKLRTAEAAHPQMREVAKQAYALLKEADPVLFDGIC